MIRASPEIAAIIRRWNRAVRLRDAATLRNLLSASDALRYVGSAEGEYWHADVVRGGFVDHVQEIPDFTEEESDLEAFENGETGWAVWHGNFTFAGTAGPGHNRITFVLALEDGSWKIAQMHISNPTPNLTKMGVELTALDKLVAAARKGFSLDQREGMATIMFTDIADSSAIAAALGDRLWGTVIARHIAALTDLVEAAGGQMVKSLGDGTMSAFASARDALGAAAAIQRQMQADRGEPPLRVRIGLHSGDVIQTRDDFFGTVVNKAARIASAALADEIRLSEATRVMADGGQFDIADPVTVPLRGLEGDHLIHRLDWSQF